MLCYPLLKFMFLFPGKTDYEVTHDEAKTYKFRPHYFCMMDIPLEIPSEQMFQRKVTKLIICTSSHPGDKEVQKDMILDRERFCESHKGHDEDLQLTTKNRSVEIYFVSDDHSAVFSFTWFSIIKIIIMMFCCLLLPYRLYLFCTMGHMKYRINKRVYRVQELGMIQICQLNDDISIETAGIGNRSSARHEDIEFYY